MFPFLRNIGSFNYFIVLLASLTSNLQAENRAGLDKSVLFRLEKIPLEVFQMKDLSAQLIVLSEEKHPETPQWQRRRDQLLLLAKNLDPVNQNIKIRRFPQFNEYTGEDLGRQIQAERAKEKIQVFIRWLKDPEAGAEAQVFAQYLQDATFIEDQYLLEKPISANWHHQIASIADYEKIYFRDSQTNKRDKAYKKK